MTTNLRYPILGSGKTYCAKYNKLTAYDEIFCDEVNEDEDSSDDLKHCGHEQGRRYSHSREEPDNCSQEEEMMSVMSPGTTVTCSTSTATTPGGANSQFDEDYDWGQ